MGFASEFFLPEAQFVEAAGCEVAVIFADYRERAPESVGLESHYYVYAGFALNPVDQIQISAQPVFIYNIIWCGEILLIHYFIL